MVLLTAAPKVHVVEAADVASLVVDGGKNEKCWAGGNKGASSRSRNAAGRPYHVDVVAGLQLSVDKNAAVLGANFQAVALKGRGAGW